MFMFMNVNYFNFIINFASFTHVWYAFGFTCGNLKHTYFFFLFNKITSMKIEEKRANSLFDSLFPSIHIFL